MDSEFYDGDGLRISRTDNLTLPPKTTYYVWDTENHTGYPQVVEEIENNQVVRRYGYGLFLENVDIWNGTSFERFYVIRDGTNSVRMLLDSTGNVSATYDYDAFGNILSTTNNNPLTIGNPYQFHSEYKDPATNLVYLRARWYDVEKGRFLNKDEFEGSLRMPSSLNKYTFPNNNPITYNDPTGHFGMVEIASMNAYFNVIATLPKVTMRNEGDLYFPPLPPQFNSTDLQMPDPLKEIAYNTVLCLNERKHDFLTKLFTFNNRVHKTGIWDYKYWYAEIKGEKSGNPHFELLADFGNFNFGVTGRALGFGRSFLHTAAGAAQQVEYKLNGIQPGADPVYEWTKGDEVDDYFYVEWGFKYWQEFHLRNFNKINERFIQ